MSPPNQDNAPVSPRRRARNFAAGLILVPGLVWLVIAFVVSWPLGPGYVDEGGLTVLRIALATLVLGLAFLLGSLGMFLTVILRDILARVQRLTEELEKVRGNKL
jgi:hypothetical protein